MASTSHRRCQYRGDGCTGVAHAGHDQCAHCYFQFVRPALKAEREEMKRRRALKRLNATAPTTATPPLTVSRAITEVLVKHDIDQAVQHALEDGKDPSSVVGDLLLKETLATVPATAQIILKPRKEAPPTDMPTVSPPPPRRRKHVPLTPEKQAEILEMYKSGISTGEIQTAYGIGTQTLYTLVRRAGIPLRGNRPARLASHAENLAATAQVMNTALTLPTPNGLASDLTEWVVTYTVTRTETVKIAARNFKDAANALLTQYYSTETPDEPLEIVSVAKVNH